jgi:hypothetical protein
MNGTQALGTFVFVGSCTVDGAGLTISLGHSAWLQSADEAKKREQTQFRLLADNLSLPVSTNATVYAAIMEAWITAMKALDSLIQGAPQRIDNGAVLLGLLAWHLYPDILLADTDQYVKQNDPLISSGGVITIGLKNRDNDGRGVFWSLPLSQAKYYGDPVIATRHAGVGESRIPFSDFAFVVLGSLLGRWMILGVSLEVALNLIRTVLKPFSDPSLSSRLGLGSDMAWASTLVDAVTEFHQSRDTRRQHITRLISFGQRRQAWFRSQRLGQLFGLTDLCTLLVAFGDNTNGRIDFLRNWAMMALDPELQAHAIIRFRQGGRLGRVRYTTVQHPANSHKRQKVGVSAHPRPSTELYPQWIDDETVVELDAADSSEDDRQSMLLIPVAAGENPEPHAFVCGDPNLAAIYVSGRCSSSLVARARAENSRLTLSQLILCMEEGYIVQDHIVTALTGIARRTKHFECLQAFSVAGHIYSKLDGARVDLQVTSRRISAARWWKAAAGSHELPLAASLSCIAYFETGGFDIDPEFIGDNTFAMCYSTSIFVASSMLSDPINATLSDENSFVKRIIGNVGKPGLAFLIAPPNPRKRALDYGSWHVVAHEPFDGTAQDNFQKTSFHLSFTGYALPLDVGVRGGCDTPAYFLETAISIYDRGEWVADVDILSAMEQWHLLPGRVSCGHPGEPQFDARDSLSLVSIDTWLELLDPPIQDAVVRAHGNPIARLAAAALAVRQCQTVIVLSDPVCWKCCAKGMRRHRNISPARNTHLKSGERKIQRMAEDAHSGVHEDADGSGSDDAEVYAFDLPTVGSDIEESEEEGGQDNGTTRTGGIALIY